MHITADHLLILWLYTFNRHLTDTAICAIRQTSTKLQILPVWVCGSLVTAGHTSSCVSMCAYTHALFDPSTYLCQSIMSSRQDMHLWLCLVCPVSFSSFHSRSCPSLQTRVTLLHQMAFCLAELHLWSTKSSLQVKGSTYHHVQSPSLSLSLSIILSLALSVITHFVFTPSPHLTCIFFNNLTLSQHQFILSSHFLFSRQTLMLLMALYCIIHDILYIVSYHLNWICKLFGV